MRIFLDTDVLLDFAMGREPHAAASGELLAWAEAHPGRCAASWHSLSNIIYITRGDSRGFLRDLLEFVEVPRTGGEHMIAALDLNFRDLEDAMQAVAAMLFSAQFIVTRNTRDYLHSPIKAITPSQALAILRKS